MQGELSIFGSIIPLIDIRLRFVKPECEYNELSCIIVTKINEMSIGFIVDEVDEVTHIKDEEISFPPKVSDN